jgi:poly(3-hydroxybutyrate) depolymerase
MYCYQRDKIRKYWRSSHFVSEEARRLLLNPNFPLSQLKMVRAFGAIHEIIHRWTRPNKHPEFDIPYIKLGEQNYQVVEKMVFQKPFCQLKLFEKKGYAKEQPAILVVAPLSGHYATLVRDTIQTLLQDHKVYVTDWVSAYNVPLSDGKFDLDTYVDYLKDFHAFLGPGVHVLAVCQPCVPVLMAAALMAEDKVSYQPKSMILMGGPVDTRINSTAVNQMTEKFSLDWFERHMVSEIPHYAPGSGRKVTPGNLILAGFIQMNIWTHIKKHYDHIINVANKDEKAANAHRSFYDEYLTVMDLPAEYFIQTVDKVFKRHLLAKNEMDYRGRRLNLAAIQSTALMTIEGENDDITGLGQTYAAHALCPNIPETKRDHFLRLDVGHYGIFSGSRWRKDIYPQIRNFIQKNL